MLQGEHSAILWPFIMLPFVIKMFVLSFFECPFKTGFTVYSVHVLVGRINTAVSINVVFNRWSRKVSVNLHQTQLPPLLVLTDT